MKIIASAVSLLASLSSCNAEESFLRAAISTDETPTPTIIDLSQAIPRDEAAISSSPGSKAVQEAAAEDPLIRNVMVLENGSIVSSYHRDDVDPNEIHQLNSVTKSWMSLLCGIMVKDGLLSVDTTLGEIFPDDEAWADVTDGSTDFRKGVTVKEFLTMTSGLIDNLSSSVNRAVDGGGQSLEGTLSYGDVDIEVKGKWDYFIHSNILSYIIVELTGMTPRQFSAERVMGKLGISEDEYDWSQNADGVEGGGAGLRLTPMQMAKFGQLYLQGGRTSPSNDERVISEEWIDASFTHYSTTDWSSVGMGHENRLNGKPYGYLFVGIEEGSTVYCAFGNDGQVVCVDRDLGRVVIATREINGKNEGLSDLFKVVDAALEKSLSFRAPNSGLSGISSTVESRAE